MRRQLLLLSFLAALAAIESFAQASVGVIVYADGGDITILRDDDRLRLDAGAGEALGEPVYAGDQVTTADDTFAEIQLLTGRNLVKIAENTTFVVAELRDGHSTLSVTYGRLRSRVERLVGTGGFEVRGITAIAGVRGTDFAYDQVLDPASGELYNRVSCFEGQVVVAASAQPELSATIGAGESVLAPVGVDPDGAVFEPVPGFVRAFWDERPFVREPVPPGDIMEEFPDLLDRAERRLGSAPAIGTPAAEASRAEDAQAADAADEVAQREPAAEPDEGRQSDEETWSEAQQAADDGQAGDGGQDAPEVAQAPRVSEQDTAGAAGDDAAGADEAAPAETERRERVARGFRTTGIVLAGAGLVTDLAAIGLFYFGEDIIPGWTAASNEYLRPVAIAGVGMLTGGLISIVVSLAISP